MLYSSLVLSVTMQWQRNNITYVVTKKKKLGILNPDIYLI